MRSLRSSVRLAEEKMDLVRVNNASLKQTNESLTAKVISCLNKNTKKSIDAFEYSLPRQYIGGALIFDKEMSGWDQKKFCELNPEGKPAPRKLTGRAEVIYGNSIVTHSGLLSIPKSPIVFEKSK